MVSSTRLMLGGGLHVDDALAAAGLEAVLVDVGAHAVAVLRDREHEAESNSQNGNPSKINPEKVARFSSPNPDRQLTSFHQQSTTNSPSKNHVLPPVFAKTPQQKRGSHHTQKNTAKAPFFEQGFGFFGGRRRRPLCPGLRGRRPWRHQPAQTLRLRRMRQGCPQKTSARSFSGEPASPNGLILWGFSRVLRRVKADRNYACTEWRWMQSAANHSLIKANSR